MNELTRHFFLAGANVFSQADIAAVISGTDHRRHGLTKRALAAGEILAIRRGLYCLAPDFRKRPLGVYAVAQATYGPSYISMESALRYHGWIPEAVHACTNAGLGHAREWDTPLGPFSYQRVPQKTLYVGVDRFVDEGGAAFLMASPAKALADYLYVRRLEWTGIEPAVGSLRLEYEDLSDVPPDELTTLAENYNNQRVKRFLAGWREAIGEAAA